VVNRLESLFIYFKIIIYIVETMLFVDIVDEENSHIEALRKSGANGNCITQKLTDELKMVYDKEMASSDGKSFSILGNVKLRIRFEVSRKEERSMEPSEFKVLGPDWTGPDLIIDTCNSLLKFRIRCEKRECSLYHRPFFLIYSQHISDPIETEFSGTLNICYIGTNSLNFKVWSGEIPLGSDQQSEDITQISAQ
jgi:hypothetical protein